MAGAPAPKMLWRPGLVDLTQPALKQLMSYWEALRARAAVPCQDQIDPLDLRFALGYIMLLEVVDGGRDFRYRLYGSKISARTGFDMTGKLVSENPNSSMMGDFFCAGYRAVLARGEPLLTIHLPPPEVSMVRWSRLILPFADASGQISRLMVGNMPGSRSDPL